jgi:hypothetical protein
MRKALHACLAAGTLIAGAAALVQAATPVEDRFLIMELMDRYGVVHDFGTPEEYAALFTDDAEVTAPDGRVLWKGREGLVKQAQLDHQKYGTFQTADGKISLFMRHVITNRQVTLTGSSTAEGSSHVITMINDQTAGPLVFSMTRYVDRYQKVRGEWRISHRINAGESANRDLARKWFR